LRTLALLLLVSCSGVQPTIDRACNVRAAGDWDDRFAPSNLTQSDVAAAVGRAIDAATLTTDIKLADQTENCRNLGGLNVYTKRQAVFDLWGVKVAGFTNCGLGIIVVSTPETGDFIHHGALIHELMHALQCCESTKPVDPLTDDQHANWARDGIYSAIDYERSRP
jgi:hypothetical protein